MENNTELKIIPPNSIDAEIAVLSAMFMDDDAASIAVEALSVEDFYREDNKVIFECLKELYNERVPMEAVTITAKLEAKEAFEKIGGAIAIANLIASASSSVNIKYYVEIVSTKSILRKLIKSNNEISSLCYAGSEKLSTILERAEKGIFDIVQNRRTEEFSHIRDITIKSFESIEKIFNSKQKITGIATGFIDFDAKTAGLQPSDLILLAARPSMGKTAFALNVAQHAAIKEGITTAIFSLEMSKDQLVNRILCSEAMVDAQRFRTGALEESDWAKLVQAMGPLSEADIYIDDTPGITPMEIRSKCRKLKIKSNLGLILIDYLQLMSGDSSSNSRQQEISDISRSLKAIAREIGCPVIALSQLSRAPEQRADHRPMLSDLRESGAIEQDADVVAFLYRDEYYFPETDKKNIAELIIAKQRNGPTGTVDLTWLGQYTKFGNAMRQI